MHTSLFHTFALQAAKAAEEQRRLSRSKPKAPEDNLFDGDLLGPGALFKFERDNSKQVGHCCRLDCVEWNEERQVMLAFVAAH